MTKKNEPQPNDPWKHDKSVFASQSVWRYRYRAGIHLVSITGGTPSDPRVAKAWLATRLGGDDARDRLLAAKLAETMAERTGADPKADPDALMAAAVEQAAININGFKRTPEGHLYVEGRTLKSMIKENVSIGLGSGTVPSRLGLTKKGAPSFIAEHVMVEEDVIVLYRDGQPITEPDEVAQSFVHTWRGSGLDYSEIVRDADVDFTVVSDFDLSDLWPVLWTTAEQNGLGAKRSQGSGKFVVWKWDPLK